eukprot:scaffold2063_cov401-Prasinococcus_capsulatus_cf.AAC.6
MVHARCVPACADLAFSPARVWSPSPGSPDAKGAASPETVRPAAGLSLLVSDLPWCWVPATRCHCDAGPASRERLSPRPRLQVRTAPLRFRHCSLARLRRIESHLTRRRAGRSILPSRAHLASSATRARRPPGPAHGLLCCCAAQPGIAAPGRL